MKEQYKERSQHQSSDQPRRDNVHSRPACWFCNEPGHQEKDCELKTKFRNQLRNGKQNPFNSHPQQGKTSPPKDDKGRWTPRSNVAASTTIKPRGPAAWEDADDGFEDSYYLSTGHHSNVTVADLSVPEEEEGQLQLLANVATMTSATPASIFQAETPRFSGDYESEDDGAAVGYDLNTDDDDFYLCFQKKPTNLFL